MVAKDVKINSTVKISRNIFRQVIEVTLPEGYVYDPTNKCSINSFTNYFSVPITKVSLRSIDSE